MIFGVTIISNLFITAVFTAWVLLFPVGLFLIVGGVIKRKGKLYNFLGILLMLAATPIFPVVVPFYRWQFDTFSGWKLQLSVSVPPYNITLHQKPGVDFYNSYFEITRPDGKTAWIGIDEDDSRWWNPEILRRDGRIYFLRDSEKIGDRTSYVDLEKKLIFSGYYQKTYKFSELQFNEAR